MGPTLEVVATIGFPLAAVIVVARILIARRRGTWIPLRRTPTPLDRGTRVAITAFAAVASASGVVVLVDGVRSGDAWTTAAGAVRFGWFALTAWLVVMLGRDLGEDERFEEHWLLTRFGPRLAFTGALLGVVGVVVALAAAQSGQSSWWIAPPAVITVALVIVVRRYAAAEAHGRRQDT